MFSLGANALEQFGLADAAKTDHHEALGGPAQSDPLQRDARLMKQLLPTRQLGRRRPGTRRVGIENRIHNEKPTHARRSPEILTTRAARRRALACSPGIPEPPLGCCRALRASFGPGCGIPAALDSSPPPNRPRLSRTSPTAATARRSCAWPQACPNDGADAFRDQDARAGLEAGAPVRGGLEARAPGEMPAWRVRGVPLGTADRSTARQGASGRSGRRRPASRAWRCRRRRACPSRGHSISGGAP